jgi:general secretion pathway protein F
MPSYRYEAVDTTGTTSKGVLHADSPRAARSTLRARGLLPLAINLIAAQVDTHANFLVQLFAERLSTNELALFTRQLASLLEAGLPLEQAFSALREQAERPYMRDLIASIRAEVMGGASLSDALCRHG